MFIFATFLQDKIGHIIALIVALFFIFVSVVQWCRKRKIVRKEELETKGDGVVEPFLDPFKGSEAVPASTTPAPEVPAPAQPQPQLVQAADEPQPPPPQKSEPPAKRAFNIYVSPDSAIRDQYSIYNSDSKTSYIWE